MSSATVDVQILAFNDFHGHLEPPAGSSGRVKLPDGTTVDAGGAAHFAHHVGALRATNPNTVVVSAGDLVGASPLISGLFHNEPAVEAMNLIGLDFNGVGNHEFDKGTTELLRLKAGGCHPVTGCEDGTPFPGAKFDFLAANVVNAASGTPLFPAYGVREFDGVKVAFIGMTLEGTPSIVTPAGVAGFDFKDEVETVNALVPTIRAQGIETIVVLLHEGGLPSGFYNECPGISGPIVDIATRMSDAVDVIASGHTHEAYNCLIAGKLVTSAASFGRIVTDIDLQIDRATGDVKAKAAKNVIATREAADPQVASFVAACKDAAAPLANRPIGTIAADFDDTAPENGPGLSQLGAFIADSQLAATQGPTAGSAVIAFMNPGGVRTSLVFAAAPGEATDGIVTFGETFAVQPFGNNLVVMSLTGAQIKTALEQQFHVD
ncbi:MAG TPA: bifunctional metallophosphatase/5'-nucleotidase, partial [Polyangiaceae bacterium]|nr:bifunctional metallophosphatase/5'-nucleotidase [Polyangiaceae bacterium]